MRGALAAALATSLLVLFPGQPSAQSDEQQTREKLEQLERDIARIQQAIDSDTVERIVWGEVPPSFRPRGAPRPPRAT